MHRRRPIIGVSGPDRGGAAAWWFTRVAILLAGGSAIRITPASARRTNSLDGLILGGGADVDPALYGQELIGVLPASKPPTLSWGQFLLDSLVTPITWLARRLAGRAGKPLQRGRIPDVERDKLEMSLLAQAVAQKLPVLGICRGMQLINVYFGGTLHQSLAGLYVEDAEVRTIRPRKILNIVPETRLRRVVAADQIRVNALHSQAIDRLGAGLCVAACDRNGIIQAIEHQDLPLIEGVQWHPEFLPQRPSQRAIFAALVRRAREQAPRAREVHGNGASLRSGISNATKLGISR